MRWRCCWTAHGRSRRWRARRGPANGTAARATPSRACARRRSASSATVASRVALVPKALSFGLQHSRLHAAPCAAKAVQPWGEVAESLDALLEQSDYVSLHAPLTPETRAHDRRGRACDSMKPTAYLINTARGGLDRRGCAGACASRRAGSQAPGWTSSTEEPPDPDNPLLALDNVIVTPHAAFYSDPAIHELAYKAALHVAQALRGEPLGQHRQSVRRSNRTTSDSPLDARRRIVTRAPIYHAIPHAIRQPYMPVISALLRRRNPGQPRPAHRPGHLLPGRRFERTVSVPSGASTGAAEAHELRDGDLSRHRGLGCRRAVANIRGEIQAAVAGRTFDTQAELDGFLIELDGTEHKERLGANAILAVSLAFARAVAALPSRPALPALRRHPGRRAGRRTRAPAHVAPPHHQPVQRRQTRRRADSHPGCAGRRLLRRRPSTRRWHMTCAVFQSAADLIADKYGMRVLTADEGGLAPPFAGADAMLQDAVTAIEAAGYAPGSDVALAVDVASSHFYRDGRYHLDGKALDSAAMRDVVLGWLDRYPIVSVEDGLSEDDWAHWPDLYAGVGRTGAGAGRRFPLHQPGAHPPRHRRPGGGRPAAQGQPDRHADRSGGGLPPGARSRLGRHHQRAQRRDRRQLAGRPLRRLGRRPDQGRLHHPVGPAGQVQPPADHRSARPACRSSRGRVREPHYHPP